MPAEIRYRPATPRDATIVAHLIAAGFATYRDFAPDGWNPRTPMQEEPEVYDRLRGWLTPTGGRAESSSAHDLALMRTRGEPATAANASSPLTAEPG